MNNSNIPILVFGSSLTGVGVIRSFARAGLPAFSICLPTELQTKSRWYRPLPEAGRVPKASELPAFLAGLSLPRAVLIPCSDDWARAVAGLPEALKDRFLASISDLSVMDTMTDKWRFAEMLQRTGVPHPRTTLLQSLGEMSELPESCYENMFLKPLNSQEFSLRHGVKAFLIKSKAGALGIMAKAPGSERDGFPILLQEYIPGPPTNHYFVDGFVDRNGRICALFARRRLRMFPPLLGNSSLMETVPVDQVRGAIDSIERMWSALNYRGIFSAEFKYDDRDGQFKILEVNARPWWYIEFATRSGVDVCSMAYLDALSAKVEPVHSYPLGRRCVYLPNDFKAFRADKSEANSFLGWVRSWIRAEKTVFCWDDPGPAAYSTFCSLRSTVRALKGIIVPKWAL
jgi:D-aspartate ligase